MSSSYDVVILRVALNPIGLVSFLEGGWPWEDTDAKRGPCDNRGGDWREGFARHRGLLATERQGGIVPYRFWREHALLMP